MGKRTRPEDITGMKFGKLTAIECVGRKQRSGRNIPYWKCKCNCGNYKEIAKEDLFSGSVVSCGCHKLKCSTKHGGYKERLYSVWKDMRNRCHSCNDESFSLYGGRGITICEEWNDYSNFRKWAMDNGYDPYAEFQECTIDRIDNDGNYEPNNCRFVNMVIQANNTRRNIKIDMDGTVKTMKQWSDILGCDYKRVCHRRDAKKDVREWFECELPYKVVKVV